MRPGSHLEGTGIIFQCSRLGGRRGSCRSRAFLRAQSTLTRVPRSPTHKDLASSTLPVQSGLERTQPALPQPHLLQGHWILLPRPQPLQWEVTLLLSIWPCRSHWPGWMEHCSGPHSGGSCPTPADRTGPAGAEPGAGTNQSQDSDVSVPAMSPDGACPQHTEGPPTCPGPACRSHPGGAQRVSKQGPGPAGDIPAPAAAFSECWEWKRAGSGSQFQECLAGGSSQRAG